MVNPGNIFHSNSIDDITDTVEFLFFQETLFGVGKDVGFGIRGLCSFVTRQSRRSPRGLFVVNRGQIMNFSLVLNQPFSHLE